MDPFGYDSAPSGVANSQSQSQHNDGHQPKNQPATPRMLRSVSGTLKNSRSDLNHRQPSEDMASPNYVTEPFGQHNLSFQQPVTPQSHPPPPPPPPPQQQQQQQPQSLQQQIHKRVPSFSKSIPPRAPPGPSRSQPPPPPPAPINTSVRNELLPPASINSPELGHSKVSGDLPRYTQPQSQSQSQSSQHHHHHHHHSVEASKPHAPPPTQPVPVSNQSGSVPGPVPVPAPSPAQTPAAATVQQSNQSNQKPPAQQQFYRKSIGDWDFVKTIGAGSMGKVKLAQHNTTHEICAVKIIPRAAKLYQRAHANDAPPTSTQEAAQRHKEYEKEIARDKRTIREGSLGRLLFHPFICRLYEMVPMTNHYYMLFEYVEGGQMLDYIVAHGSLKEKHARKFARGIGSALDYCHRNNVVHRDLKIENIMINEKGDIKIIDFGLSNLYSPKSLLKTYCGSLYFAAPELLSAKPYTGPEVDIWSFGVVLYVLVCGKVPFDDQSVSVLHEKIKKGNVEYPDFLSRECISLLSRMLVVDPTKRASLFEVLQHPWMNKGYDYKVSSYLPKRIPLTLPLDGEIIKTIASFDLGSIQHITEELTNVLTSVEYQMSCENWYKLTDQGREYASASNAHILPDPTGGFHPLISIYYLVDEMKKRKKAKEEAVRAQQQQQQQQQQLQQQQQQLQAVKLDVPVRSISTEKARAELLTAQAPLAAISFPPQAHTSTIPTTTHRNSQSPPPPPPKELPESVIPEQQLSPRDSNNGRDTLDPAKNAGINSILRKLSYKKKSSSPPPPSGDSNRSPPPLPTLETGTSGTSTNTNTSASASGRRDPMVRRGVSMKITAKEKSTSSRLNLGTSANNSSTNSTETAKSKSSTINTNDSSKVQHGRSSSTNSKAPAKFHGFIPVEIMPPVPKYSGNTVIPANDKLSIESGGRKLHPTARAKSVGGHIRKDSYNYNRNRGTSSQYPPLPNAMANQNSDELVGGGSGGGGGAGAGGSTTTGDTSSNNTGFFDDVRLDDVDYQEIAQLTEEEIIEQFNNAKPNSMPSIEHCKTLFLKGFFSVQTTSTKPLPVIRYNIINVLSKLGVRFQEVKGGFVCIHTPSVQPLDSLLIQQHHIEAEAEAAEAAAAAEAEGVDGESHTTGDSHGDENSEERKLYGDAFKSTSSSIHEKEILRTKTPEPEQRTPSRQPSLQLNSQPLSPSIKISHKSSNSIGGHRRKFSVGGYRKKNGSQVLMPPNTPATTKVMRGLYPDDEFEYDEYEDRGGGGDDNSADSLNGYGGGSDMLISSKLEQKARHQHSVSNASGSGNERQRGSKSPLKFEIHIVKVPLVGLYGVQFKKLLGNTWNYKTLASQILTELNL
ncbi:uncharacterized protein RJT21DRAFT_122679 [Scheffersomyces amazonensis]|uniref:uncharacterized protein n=1 Tax=Scheffersomyces amazonensis TaxID=1078765 RepID=UPI00315D25D9